MIDATPELAAFRAEVRAFIAEALPADLRARVERNYNLLEKDDLVFWQKQLHARGWGAPSWPREDGGTGWDAAHRQVFEDECAAACCPRTQPQGVKMLGPILCAFGTEAQKKRFLPPILSADEWWCQGYSEPGAGSDLAALSTRAVREGDHYVVTGHKTWTSWAHAADWMFCLVRTNAGARPQEGISFLLIDMRSPGITLRPIRTIEGGEHVNDVFLDGVRVPVGNRIGEEGKGWTYAKALLSHERAGIAELGRSRERLARIQRILRTPSINGSHLLRDERFRARVALVEVELLAAEATTLRLLEGGGSPALSSILKLRGSEISQELSRLAVEALGPQALRYDIAEARSAPSSDDPLPSFAIGRASEYLTWRAHTIAGGSSEVQRNIIAKLAFDNAP